MENGFVESAYISTAIQLEKNGQIKDAYFSFISSSQNAIQSLTDIKFVHSSIVSSPKHHFALLSTLKICIDHLEHIIEIHSPKQISKQTTNDSKAPPPPLPPKPLKGQRPLVPPKPARVSTTFAEKKESVTSEKVSESPTAIQPRVNFNLHNNRPVSLPMSQPPQQTEPDLLSTRPQTDYFCTNNPKRSVEEGEVDPYYLVPAQTNAGDSLTPASVSSLNTNHVPLIPTPPLLTVHRNLQTKLKELEDAVKNCRLRKQALVEGRLSLLESMTEEGLDQTIAQHLRETAEIKATLNGVRTIYMNAATIPTVLQFGAHVIAYQLALIESSIFNTVPPHALLQHSSKHPHSRIVASTDFFNYITRCIEHSVLLPQEASARAQLIHYWIKVASRSLDINNYQTLKAIISSLNTPPVQRLKRTWSYIPKRSMVKLEALNDLMSEANNYGNYREHMGMVNTSVVHGKSVQSIRSDHFSRPTVPFLGTFVHDITYLLAVFKSNAMRGPPENDPRIHEILNTMQQFQTGPKYTSSLPLSLLKSCQKHHFRPVLSNVLQRGASRIQRFSGGNIFGFDSNNSNHHGANSNNTTHSNSGHPSVIVEKEIDEEENNLDEQQKMATQYILMRSWVSQNTVDELSTLREPPQTKSNSMLSSRTSIGGSSSNINRTSSVFSNNTRLSAGNPALSPIYVSDHRPSSVDSYT
ncbi:ras guanine nucleotide exchange factor domain-containing protein [Sporodiniella umbellata]|nr:ras guanine nucleotide exchange factor domain-containing protein [Sporodiniella umbellata]